MFTLIVENEKGEQLELTHNENYDVMNIEGTGPPTGTINTINISGVDGSYFNSSRVEQRNLVLTLNIKSPIELNRLNLYKYIHVKRPIKVYFKNQNRDVYIEGYVETFEINLFGMTQQPQISIICPKPFWNDMEDIVTDFSNIISLFEFPFNISSDGIEISQYELSQNRLVDAGDVETGATFEFSATTSQVLNPIIYNRTTQQFFGLNVDMSKGDKIVINTNQGEKSITLIRGTVKTNLLSKRKSGSNWLQLLPGENEISYNADEGVENLNLNILITRKYEGV